MSTWHIQRRREHGRCWALSRCRQDPGLLGPSLYENRRQQDKTLDSSVPLKVLPLRLKSNTAPQNTLRPHCTQFTLLSGQTNKSLMAQTNTRLAFYSSVGQKFQMGPTGLSVSRAVFTLLGLP